MLLFNVTQFTKTEHYFKVDFPDFSVEIKKEELEKLKPIIKKYFDEHGGQDTDALRCYDVTKI